MFFKTNFLPVNSAARQLTYLLQDIELWDFNVFLPEYGCNLQRPLVWEDAAIKNGFDRFHYHRNLIESLLSYVDIGKIVLYAKRLKTAPHLAIYVIDGKQRVNAILDFFNNKFGVFRGGVEYFYRDMGSEARTFKQMRIDVCEIDSETYPMSDLQLLDLFEAVNFAGVPQDENHVKKIKNKND
jgi:hypothetical protein